MTDSEPSPDSGSTTQPVFPFIVGSGRSGTTLLRAVFDSHPQLAIPDEVSFIVRLSRVHYARRYGWPKAFRIEPCVDLLLENGSLRRWGLDPDEVRAALTTPPSPSFADAVRRLYRLWAEHQGKPRYGDKTPMHVLHLRRLARMFPEARFVHIIRDGRDVALSYLDVAWGPRTIEEAAVEWRRRVTAGRSVGQRLGPGRYHEVRYEELVADAEPVVRRLCRFVDLPWDEHLLRHDARAAEVIAATRFPEAHQRLRMAPTVGLRDWRREMDRAEVARYEAIAGPLLDQLGYQTVTDRVGAVDRLRVRRQVAVSSTSRWWASARAGARVVTGR